MQEVQEIIQRLSEQLGLKIEPYTELSYEERLERDCKKLNGEQGKLTDYDCKDCLNRGIVYFVKDNEIVCRDCHCMSIRDSIKRVANSGLSEQLDKCSFDNFLDTQDWQKGLKQKAMEFCQGTGSDWFFVGGQVGAGKTHICTAIVGELLKQGKSAKYMLWRDEAVRLKAVVNDETEYTRLINPLKTADVLYIDDFFKTPKDEQGKTKPPTPGDINVAFELLNARYISRDKITIISSEHTVKDILNYDEAVGSRVYERTKNYCCIISKSKGRNYRLRGTEQ